MPAIGIVITDSSDQEYESGDEYRTWTVAAIDDDGEAVGQFYTYRSREAAHDLAIRMSADRRLPFLGYE
jgi:hypothetical protein